MIRLRGRFFYGVRRCSPLVYRHPPKPRRTLHRLLHVALRRRALLSVSRKSLRPHTSRPRRLFGQDRLGNLGAGLRSRWVGCCLAFCCNLAFLRCPMWLLKTREGSDKKRDIVGQFFTKESLLLHGHNTFPPNLCSRKRAHVTCPGSNGFGTQIFCFIGLQLCEFNTQARCK